jgi:anaerobic ribonucleoside-triphosphate reductase
MNGNLVKSDKVKCEIYSRVSGYYRPVQQWNKGKQAEMNDRVYMIIPESVK